MAAKIPQSFKNAVFPTIKLENGHLTSTVATNNNGIRAPSEPPSAKSFLRQMPFDKINRNGYDASVLNSEHSLHGNSPIERCDEKVRDRKNSRATKRKNGSGKMAHSNEKLKK